MSDAKIIHGTVIHGTMSHGTMTIDADLGRFTFWLDRHVSGVLMAGGFAVQTKRAEYEAEAVFVRPGELLRVVARDYKPGALRVTYLWPEGSAPGIAMVLFHLFILIYYDDHVEEQPAGQPALSMPMPTSRAKWSDDEYAAIFDFFGREDGTRADLQFIANKTGKSLSSIQKAHARYINRKA